MTVNKPKETIMKKFIAEILVWLELFGKARAASSLARLGYAREAQKIMEG